jgi:hypothetical protein
MSTQDASALNGAQTQNSCVSGPTINAIGHTMTDDQKKRDKKEKQAAIKRNLRNANQAAEAVAKCISDGEKIIVEQKALHEKLTDMLLRCKNEVEAVRNYFRHKPVNEKLLGTYSTFDEWTQAVFHCTASNVRYHYTVPKFEPPLQLVGTVEETAPPAHDPAATPFNVADSAAEDDVEDADFTEEQPETPTQPANPILTVNKTDVSFEDAARGVDEAVRIAVTSTITVTDKLFEHLDEEEYSKAVGNFFARLHDELFVFNGRLNKKTKTATA